MDVLGLLTRSEEYLQTLGQGRGRKHVAIQIWLGFLYSLYNYFTLLARCSCLVSRGLISRRQLGLHCSFLIILWVSEGALVINSNYIPELFMALSR